MALSCLLTLVFAAPLLAQAEPTEPIPQPPSSVEDFSLTPGTNAPAPQPAPTGPVDDTAPPVTTTPAPVQPATVEPSATEGLETAPATAPQTAPQATQSQTSASRAQQPARSARRTPAQPRTQTETATPLVDPESETSEQDSPPSETTTSPTDPVEQSVPVPADPLTTEAEQSSDQSTLYLGTALAIILLGGLGFFLWRRKATANQVVETDEAAPPPSKPRSEEKSKIPAEEPAPVIAEKPGTSASSDGFVTTKIRKPEPTVQPAPTAKPVSDQLSIEFQAQSASSTLVNAIVGYSIKIENRSGQPLNDLHISGTMIQADKNLVETAASSQGQLLHELGDLAAGQSEQASGDIRLPLATFQPIDFQSQKLFVPLVLLRFDYTDSDGNAQMQAVNYLIGTEHVPPRDKMAPFRLDLGPRNFGDVAHRPFQS